jgi:hypothetical protein
MCNRGCTQLQISMKSPPFSHKKMFRPTPNRNLCCWLGPATWQLCLLLIVPLVDLLALTLRRVLTMDSLIDINPKIASHWFY